nr:MAG TPA: lipoprotein [Caudoviricetes sp.]
MTRERKKNLCILLIICIAMLLLAGCATKKKAMAETTSSTETSKVEREKDSTITETHETTKVTERLVPVEVEIPAASKERTTHDTTSVLETDLYKSTASWKDGVLHHTLEAKPGAKVKGTAAVRDTTKSSSTRNENKKTRNSSTDSKNQQDNTKEVTKTETTPSWAGWLTAGIIISIAATLAILYRYRKRGKK